LAEWFYEAGIGENRAALIEDGQIIRVLIDREGEGPRAGAVMPGRLRADKIVELLCGDEVLIDFVPPRTPEGASVRVAITREALPERGKAKRAKGRVVGLDTPLIDAPSLFERISRTDAAINTLSLQDPDRLEAAGWTETLEAATSGVVAFSGGALRISLTPAMTLIDVDGSGSAATLAIAGATAAAGAILCFDLAGSIGLDLPTLSGKVERLSAAEAFDRALPSPFERTAVNGFGFMQIIRPRERASLCEQLTMDPAGAEALALLRKAQRSGIVGAVQLVAAPPVAARISAAPAWLDQLSRELGGAATLRSDPHLAIGAGHVER
jgi:hypothetical protein